jgi:hypothetical protein
LTVVSTETMHTTNSGGYLQHYGGHALVLLVGGHTGEVAPLDGYVNGFRVYGNATA